jgi:hypothetical protein
MVEVQQNPFRGMSCSSMRSIIDLAMPLPRGTHDVISSGDCVENTFRFF